MANAFDNFLAAIAPGYAAKRAFFRHVYDSYRAYDAAKVGRRNDGWIAGNTSANAEIGPAVGRLRARARDVARNTEIGANAVRKLSAHMVGTGITPRLIGGDKAERQASAERWRAFSENCDPEDMTDFGGMQHQIAKTLVESGTALLRFLPRPSSWRMRVPLQVQVLEPDYVDMGKNEVGNDGSVIIQGAEYDRDGRRVATWMFEEHPGDVWPLAGGKLKSKRFTMDEVRPVFDRLRAGQVWGVPWFFPVTIRVRDFADREEAEHLRKLTESCFAVFRRRPAGGATTPLATDGKKDKAGRPFAKITPGMVYDLAPGEEVQFSTPKALPGEVEQMRHQLGMIALGIGVPYHELTGDLSGANYSSLREGKLGFWQLLDVWQWLMIIPQACRPAWRQVDRLAFAMGDVRRLGAQAAWSVPTRPWVDPVKDVVGAVKAMRSGLVNPLDEIAARTGEDPEDLVEAWSKFAKTLDAAELVFDSDPRRVTSAGVGQFNDPLDPGGNQQGGQ